jgi:hypothetical protein
MTVEILRQDKAILKFKIPWATRGVGYMYETTNSASRFDPWKGYDKYNPGVWKHDRIYMSVPG